MFALIAPIPGITTIARAGVIEAFSIFRGACDALL
jgi:hypothetical protein